MKTETPRTDEVKNRSLNTYGDYTAAKLADMTEHARALEIEVQQLKKALAKAKDTSWLDEALNSGNGTYKP